MSNLATVEPPVDRRSVTTDMAHRYGMEAPAFEATLRATIFPKAGTREEFAAFLLVAREYNLNPVTREIYAMPKKGGGIIPVVSIDGWVRLANEHRAFDGMEFQAEHNGTDLVSMTCRIYRKDRAHPTEITEYLSECIRNTEPWAMKHRMLRHKSMIQCTRYAFGFAGIYEPDEAERFADLSQDHQSRGAARRAPSPPVATIEHHPAPIVEAPAEPEERREPAAAPVQRRAPPPPPVTTPAPAPSSYEDVRSAYEAAAKGAVSNEELEAAWHRLVDPCFDFLDLAQQDDIMSMHRLRSSELTG